MRRSGDVQDERYAVSAWMRRSGDVQDERYAVSAWMRRSGDVQDERTENCSISFPMKFYLPHPWGRPCIFCTSAILGGRMLREHE
jgi:hypothetical protein